MIPRLRWKTGLMLLLCVALSAHAQESWTSFEKSFQSPPESARPMVRWWWFGPAVTRAELLHEMEEMKAGGFGGFAIHFTYPLALDDPETGFRNLPFLSPEMLKAVSYTNQQAHRLGLRAGLALTSGWPYGGPGTPVTEAAATIRQEKTPIPTGETSVAIPAMEHGESLIAVFLGLASQQNGKNGAETMLPLPGPGANRLDIPASSSAGARTVYWYIQSRTGQQVKRASVGAEGFVLDHFSHAAVENHLSHVADRLIAAFGSNPPDSVFSDSLEVFGSDWTPKLPAEFQARRGYNLVPYLPELFTGHPDATALAVRHDWGETLTELIDSNYLSQVNRWARAHGTRLRSQTYGIPAVSLSSNSLVDLPEGEGSQWRQFSFMRWASSAGHLYDRPIISSETFTWLHSPAFRATPLDMEEEANRFFLEGSNQIYCHGWPYSPPMAGEPGWSFYAAAVFNQHNPWWIVMPDVTSYLARVSWVLRQGRPANRVAIYLPEDDAWAAFTPGRASLTELMSRWITPALTQAVENAGYNFDYIDAAAIRARGIHYPVLLLPNVDRMSPETLRQIRQYAETGGKVIAIGRIPEHAPGLQGYKQISAEVSSASRTFFHGRNAHVQSIASVDNLGEALHRMLTPGMQLTPAAPLIGFIRRRLPDADLYFIANTGNTTVDTMASLRSRYHSGTWLDPYTGRSAEAFSDHGSWPLHLPPYGAVILLLHSGPVQDRPLPVTKEERVLDLSDGWTVNFPSLHFRQKMQALASWTSDPRTLYFSGAATYHRAFTLSENALDGRQFFLTFGNGSPIAQPSHSGHMGTQAWFDPPIHVATVVMVNGKHAGDLWHPPYQVEITHMLRPGINEVEVQVANTAINEIAGKSRPDYRLLSLRFGRRFSPQDWNLIHPLPSGLLGKVELMRASRR